MTAFWKRQIEYLQAIVLSLIFYGVAILFAWSFGVDPNRLLLGMVLFQASLATVRAWHP